MVHASILDGVYQCWQGLDAKAWGLESATKEKTSVSCMETTSRDRIEELCSLIAPEGNIVSARSEAPWVVHKGWGHHQGLCTHTPAPSSTGAERWLSPKWAHMPQLLPPLSPSHLSNQTCPSQLLPSPPFHLNREQMPEGGPHANFVAKLKLSLRGCVTKEELKLLLAAAQGVG